MRRIEARYPGHISTENVRIHELSMNKHGRQDAYLRPACGSSSLLFLDWGERTETNATSTSRLPTGISPSHCEPADGASSPTQRDPWCIAWVVRNLFSRRKSFRHCRRWHLSSLRWRISLSLDSRVSAGLQSSHAVGTSDDLDLVRQSKTALGRGTFESNYCTTSTGNLSSQSNQAFGSWDWAQLKSQSRWLHRGATFSPADIVQPCLIQCRSG